MIRSALFALAVASCPAAGHGQTAWRRAATLEHRGGHAMAHDAARNRLVVFGGFTSADWDLDQTLLFDGSGWTMARPGVNPPARSRAAMAFDAARQRVVLFGGASPSPQITHGDTWEWDGTSWSQRQPAAAPPPRSAHAMAYDPVRGRTVLFGGLGPWPNPQTLGDTWEWDGSAWSPRTTPGSPAPRALHAMAWDPARRRIVLFGGWSGAIDLQDTWEWDGSAWLARQPAVLPSARRGHGLATDEAAGQIVLFGGANSPSGTLLRDTWIWDGASWSSRAPAVDPGARDSHAMAWHGQPGRLVLFGGSSEFSGMPALRSDTWAWSGASWQEILPALDPPRSYGGHRLAFDPARGRCVLVTRVMETITPETWEWDGTSWSRRASGAQSVFPGPLCYDGTRGRVLALGTQGTWDWDGGAWRRVAPPGQPTYPSGEMVYDEARRRVVFVAQGTLDVWEWDGTVWSPRPAAARPPYRLSFDLVFDPIRGRTLLFGGWDDGFLFGDLWAWDGSAWSLVSTTGERGFATVAFDSWRDRLVVYGGRDSSEILDDTTEWDGTRWTERIRDSGPYREGAAACFDARRGRVVLQGGGGVAWHADTWEYGAIAPARWTGYGAGCAGSAGVPLLAAELEQGLGPWLGSTLALRLGQVPAAAPALVWLGLSNQSFGGVPLPLDLGPLGLTGCLLRLSPDVPFGVQATGGVARLLLPVPGDRALLGSGFFGQALVVDLAANPAGATLSNAGEGRFGAK